MDSGINDPYFFGTVIIDCSDSTKFSLIDGQQRTTTFLLLLKALLLRLEEIIPTIKKDEDSESLLEGLKEKRNCIFDILYKTDADERSEIIKNWSLVKERRLIENKSININEQYKDELQTIIESKDYKTAEQLCFKIPRKQKDNKYTNFFRNFKFFYEKLRDQKETELNAFAKTFLKKCQIIEIRSWQIEQAITMFNSLNSTGMPLSDADIISAQLYSNSGTDKKDFNKSWETICEIASNLSLRKITDIDSVLQQYMYINRSLSKEYMKNGYPDVTTPGLRNFYTIIHKELLLKPMELCSNFYKIVQIWDKIKDYPIIKLLLKFNENAKIYLISYLNRFNVENISEENVFDIAECLLRLFTILELVDTGFSSTNFKTFLFKQNIKLVDFEIPISEIKEDFNSHIKNTWNEEELESYLLEYDKNILVFLNEYLYAKEKKLKFDFSESVNVEHIMPASGHNIDIIREDAGISSREEFDSIVNKLGNKILLEEDINKSIGKEWFKTKKQKSVKDKSGYKDSNFGIAQNLTNYPKDLWEKDDIENATKKAMTRILNFIFGEYF